MKAPTIIKRAASLFDRHSNTILTSLSIAGTITTTIFAIKDTTKAVLIVDQLKEEHPDGLPKGEMLKRVAPVYIPTGVSAALTLATIVLNGRTNAKRNAMLTTLYSGSQLALKEYQSKVVEKLGEKKAQAIHDDIQQDKVRTHPVCEGSVFPTGYGDVLFYDEWSDRYFTSSIERVRRTEIDANAKVVSEMWVTLNEVYVDLGLKPVKYGNTIGWNVDHRVSFGFSSAITEDERPCIVLEFDVEPKNYRNW